MLWLAAAVLGLLNASATAGNACSNENGGPLYERPLYNGELTVALPKDWHLVRSEPPGIMKWDDVLYYVQVDNRRVFGIDLTNNGSFSFTDTATATNVTNHGIWATEYRQDGILTNVVVKSPCGGFRYIRMWPITKNPEERPQVEAAMKSITCVAPPRPGS